MNTEIRERSFNEFLLDEEGNGRNEAPETFYAKSGGSPPIGMLWGQFRQSQFPDIPQIVFGIRRGNVGLLIAETNVGKTTLALNVALALAGDGTLPPIIDEKKGGQRVMYIDGESTRRETQDDINRMLDDWSNRERLPVDENVNCTLD